jgi:glycosyltransferase involved in cell wall biosynthesis
MPLISAITTCKGRLAHLKQTLPTLMALPDCEVVVVDYDCPQGAGAWVRDSYPRVRVVEVSDRPYFNAAAARNLGAAAATGEWLVFLDADVSVAPGFSAAVEGLLRPDAFLLADPRRPGLWGALVVERRHFNAVGGYDEVFEGWGAEDVELPERLAMRGLRQGSFSRVLLTVIAHGEAERTRFHEITDRRLNALINEVYRTAKTDLTRQGISLELEGRRRLYAGIRSAALRPEGLKTIQVPVRTSWAQGYDIQYSLRYDFTPRART